jgi:DNA-binding transcriptional MocR family regulator
MDSKYHQIIQNIQSDINTGRLKPGARLPSIRETAKLFNCNKATIIRAYEEMERNHLLYSVPKSGYYLVDNKKIPDINPGKDQIDFAAASPDITVFPYIDFQHCLNQAIDTYKESLFSYLNAPGLPSLCQVLARFLQNYQIFTSYENIFVTAGSQQALQIFTNMPFPNGKTNILVEQPTYNGMLHCCKLSGITTIGIARNEKGIDLDELERIFRNGNIKFFYTMPRFHNPLGTSYTNDQKKQILHLAQKYNVYIVEDDYLADMELDSKADPIYAIDASTTPAAKIIYVRSFSKTLMPGLRLGIAILPKLLVNQFKEYKRCADLSTSILSQGALEIYIRSGMFDSHIKKIKNLYRERMVCFKKACQIHLPAEVQAYVPETGFFANFNLPFKANYLVDALTEENIRIVNMDGMYLPEYQRDNTVRLSVCKVDPPKIEQGLLFLGQMTKALLRNLAAKIRIIIISN